MAENGSDGEPAKSAGFGKNPWFLAEQMGHVDVSMVFTTYGKFIAKDFKKPAMQPNLKVV